MRATEYAVCVAPAEGRARVFFFDDLHAAERMYDGLLAEYPGEYVDILERNADGSVRWVKRSDEVEA